MDFDESQVALIKDCVVEVMIGRQRHGHPIPERVRDLLRYVSARGHEFGSAGTESKQEPDDLIDTERAAEILDVSIRHIRRIAADLDGQRVSGTWVFHRHAVTEYANARSSA